MRCPSCGERKARRACPALGHQICASCCGTKRLLEIHCPGDCVYLASARQHPPAVVQRQQERDLRFVWPLIQPLNERQRQLFFLLQAFIGRYRPDDLLPLTDDDVAEAAGALASTYETAARGVIYEHHPSSLAAQRLAGELKTFLVEVGTGAGSRFERDATATLRSLETGAGGARHALAEGATAFVALAARIAERSGDGHPDQAPGEAGRERSPLIIPE